MALSYPPPVSRLLHYGIAGGVGLIQEVICLIPTHFILMCDVALLFLFQTSCLCAFPTVDSSCLVHGEFWIQVATNFLLFYQDLILFQ